MKYIYSFARVLILLAAVQVSAIGSPLLYNDVTLRQLQESYSISTRDIYTRLIWLNLSSQEKQALRQVRLDFPLHSSGRSRGQPLGFYTTRDLSTIVMPAYSLKFLDDLCVAYAWLQINDYTLETVSEYVGMLKYRNANDFPRGRFPQPLKALQIPNNALQDARVNELYQLHFATSRAFILAHELGHVFHKHPNYEEVEMKQARRGEEEADKFALRILNTAGVEPLGILVYFMAAAHWECNYIDFGSLQFYETYLEREATHPVTARRLEIIASELNTRLYARARDFQIIIAGLHGLANFLRDEEIQTSVFLVAQATDDLSLGPRRKGELLSRISYKAEGRSQTTGAFRGFYAGEYTRFVLGDREELEIEVFFQRHGNRVNGRFSFGIGQGSMEGTLTNEILYFNWQWGQSYGRGILRATADGSGFFGTWGYRGASDGGGTWSGRRSK